MSQECFSLSVFSFLPVDSLHSSPAASVAIAGHVSQKMLARYSHVRTEARRQAVSALSAKPIGHRREAREAAGYDTIHDTKQDVVRVPSPEVIENMVGPWGLEPQTSTVSR
jgi:hypothetical protein